jgi:hypothetical protein
MDIVREREIYIYIYIYNTSRDCLKNIILNIDNHDGGDTRTVAAMFQIYKNTPSWHTHFSEALFYHPIFIF